jgi:hypothetical protein
MTSKQKIDNKTKGGIEELMFTYALQACSQKPLAGQEDKSVYIETAAFRIIS